MVDVTVFSAEGCHKCLVTKTHMKSKGIPFSEVRIDENPDIENIVRGIDSGSVRKALPVVMAFRSEDDVVPDYWFDYRPGFIDSLKDTAMAIPEAV